MIVNAHKSPDRYAEQKVTMPDGATATMICTIVDIEGEPREILFYMLKRQIFNCLSQI